MPVELGKRLEDEFEENEDDTCDVFTGGRKMRVDVDPRVPLSVLRPGQEVWLNDELNAVIGWTL